MLFLMPFLVYGVAHLPIGSASVHQWLPDGKPEKERYTRFQKHFGNDPFLIASWEGCRIDDPRLDEFRSRLLSMGASNRQLIDSVQTTKDVLVALTLSGAVHLMNYYRDISLWHRDHRGSRAMLLSFKPSLLSSITTSLGMASLAISQPAPVREFGLYSALSLSVATCFLLLGFPFVSDWFCGERFALAPRERFQETGSQLEEVESMEVKNVGFPQHIISPIVEGYVKWMERNSKWVAAIGVAMGIAVNDTLHFVNWYANRLSAGDSRPVAIADTMSNCAVAMIHTMLISCCSMLPFMFAEFIPTRQFACLMIAMIGSSILGDLVLLPALLLSPLGLCLMPRKS